MKTTRLKTKYGKPKKCICGCEEFVITYEDKSYLMHCSQCGMYCGCRRKVDG